MATPAYADATGDIDADVRDIAGRARSGERVAHEILHRAFAALGRLLGPCLECFAADVLTVGGSMAASWDVFAPSFLEGLSASGVPPPPIRLSLDAEHAALLAAAAYALRVA